MTIWIIVFLGFILTIACIAFIPVLLFFNGTLAQTSIAALSAAALAMSAFHIEPEEIVRHRTLLRKLLIVALIPAGWMLVQTLPLGFLGLGHPIWSSASTALGQSLTASISVDSGNTFIALGYYLGFIALGLAVFFVCTQRLFAERILSALLMVSAIVALLVLIGPDSIIDLSGFTPQTKTIGSIQSIIAIGCAIALAVIVRAYERSETRKKGPSLLVFTSAIPGMMVGGIVFFLCLLMTIRFGPPYIVAATIVGLAVFAGLILIRRLGFGLWGVAAIGIALTAIAFAVFTQTFITHSLNRLLPFANPENNPGAVLATRMLSDLRWSGAGAGNFAELTQLYRDVSEANANFMSGVSSAAIIAMELGRAALVFFGMVVIALAITLLRATIDRGRDWFFPAAGAATLLFLSITAFGDHALLTPALATLTAVVTGLALAQSVGHSGKR